MSTRKSKRNKPAADELAGIPVCQEEQVRPSDAAKAPGDAKRARGMQARSAGATPNELAGIPINGEGAERLRRSKLR